MDFNNICYLLSSPLLAPNISGRTDLEDTDSIFSAVFEVIVTRIFSPNSNLSFSSSLVSSCIPLLTMASYQETRDDQDGEYFFLMIIHYSSVISRLFIQSKPGPVKTLLVIRDPAPPHLTRAPVKPRPRHETGECHCVTV